jgi:hypothetical protein
MFGQLYDDRREPGMVRDIPDGRPFNRYMPTTYRLDLFDERSDARYAGSFRTAWLANGTTRPAGMALGDTAVVISKNVIPATARAGKLYRIHDRDVV